jgi:hypothetical protein
MSEMSIFIHNFIISLFSSLQIPNAMQSTLTYLSNKLDNQKFNGYAEEEEKMHLAKQMQILEMSNLKRLFSILQTDAEYANNKRLL